MSAAAPRCPQCGADPRTGESAFRSRGADKVQVCQSVGIRLLAQAIDQVILLLAFILVSLVVYLLMTGAGEFAVVGEEPSSWPLWVVFACASFVYFWICEGVWGRTPGKRFCDLRVLRADGSRIGLGRSLVRTLVRIVDVLPVFYLIGAIAVWLTPRDQRLGDLVAGTVVVRPQMMKLELIDDSNPRLIPWRGGPDSPAA